MPHIDVDFLFFIKNSVAYAEINQFHFEDPSIVKKLSLILWWKKLILQKWKLRTLKSYHEFSTKLITFGFLNYQDSDEVVMVHDFSYQNSSSGRYLDGKTKVVVLENYEFENWDVELL